MTNNVTTLKDAIKIALDCIEHEIDYLSDICFDRFSTSQEVLEAKEKDKECTAAENILRDFLALLEEPPTR